MVYLMKSDYSRLEEMRTVIRMSAESHGFANDAASQIALAVDEACTNLIRYSFPDNNNVPIQLTVITNNKEFIIEIADNGQPFNPDLVPPVDLEQYRKEYKKGGLGIHIMRSVMDDVVYKPATGKKHHNTLRLKKYLA